MRKIDSFKGEHRWLSNMYASPVSVDGIVYPTAEHAFQAAKTQDPEEKMKIAKAKSPAMAKRIGQQVTLRPDWDGVKRQVMAEILRLKFADPVLARKLVSTGDAELIEGNHWHDNYWGWCGCEKCGGQGQNVLGQLLMELRKELAQR